MYKFFLQFFLFLSLFSYSFLCNPSKTRTTIDESQVNKINESINSYIENFFTLLNNKINIKSTFKYKVKSVEAMISIDVNNKEIRKKFIIDIKNVITFSVHDEARIKIDKHNFIVKRMVSHDFMDFRSHKTPLCALICVR